jgi:hypothetical protein
LRNTLAQPQIANPLADRLLYVLQPSQGMDYDALKHPA